MPQSTLLAEKIIDFLRQEETNYGEAAKLGEAALPILNSIVLGSDEMLASKATYMAAMINSPHKGEVIANAARHQSPIVRVAAANAAGEISTDAAEKVLDSLMGDSDIGVTKFALRSVKAKNLGTKFSKQIKAMSSNHADEAIKTMAKAMVK
jgi:HEAT repeat protein